jgi:hypothetical protein
MKRAIRARPRRDSLAPVLILLLLTASVPSTSAQPPPRTIVLLCDGLSIDDLRSPAFPHIGALARLGQLALMNVAHSSGPPDVASLLPLALGFLAPAETTDFDIHSSDEAPIERANAAIVFRRRTGITVPSTSPAPLVHLGIAPIIRRGLSESLLGAILDRAGKRDSLLAAGLGNLRSGLFVVDNKGIGPSGFRAADVDELAEWIDSNRTNIIVDVGAKAHLESILSRIHSDSSRVFIVSPQAPQIRRLPVAILHGPTITPGLLTSPTTRTPGLIANIDIAPTILSWLGAQSPSTMIGHAIEGVDSSDSMDAVSRLDSRISVNEKALAPVFLLLGAIAMITIAGGLLSLRRAPRLMPVFAFLMLSLLNMPLALLIVAALPTSSVPALGATTIGAMIACAAFETLLSHRLPDSFSPPVLASITTVALVVADAFLGQPLVKYSLLSGYQVQGIRFYGIGNEYMGVVLGMTLLAVLVTEVRAGVGAVVFAMVALVVGFPRLGANAGGLVAAFVTFGCGIAILSGRRTNWQTAVGWAVAGLACAFALAMLDRALPGATHAPSHLGGAIQAAGDRGYGYFWQVVQRKVLMNARIVESPAVLAVMAGLAIMAWAVGGSMRERAAGVAAAHPLWALGIPAAAWGALAAFVFNDSGIVAALFLLGSSIAAGLIFLFSDPGSSTISPVSPD